MLDKHIVLFIKLYVIKFQANNDSKSVVCFYATTYLKNTISYLQVKV